MKQNVFRIAAAGMLVLTAVGCGRTEVGPGASSTTTSTGGPSQPAPAGVHRVTAAELGATWRPGCPVPPQRLRRVSLDYRGVDGTTRRGDIVVAEDVVAEVISVFEELFRLGYPIAGMRTVDHYPGADDELSMQDNNTSGFNCRLLPSGDGWSPHAYGRAVDVNPLVNPFVDRRGTIQPRTAGPYTDRRRTDPGMLHAGDPAVRAFTDRGWQWGGHWRSPVDYQHFERR